MFTNSHCSVCPGAHAAINSYRSISPHASRLRFIYYHTTFPYSDDQLSLANTTEPNARNMFYNGPTSTPNTFFDGANQGRTYSSFDENLDARMSVNSPLEITLSGTGNGTSLSVTATITQTSSIPQNDLVVHFVVVENVSYVGRNGVSPQDFVMRKMITPVAGESFTPELNSPKSIQKNIVLTNITDISKVSIVVFIQSISTKEVIQSESISHGSLTGIGKSEEVFLNKFSLEQNYPNPFNPMTNITFSIPHAFFVSLKVHNILGNEVAVMIKGYLEPGSYTYQFSTTDFQLPSGIYFYTLEAGGRTFVRTMTLVK